MSMLKWHIYVAICQMYIQGVPKWVLNWNRYSLLSLHMKTKVVQHVPRINISMSQTQSQTNSHRFPAFVMLTFLVPNMELWWTVTDHQVHGLLKLLCLHRQVWARGCTVNMYENSQEERTGTRALFCHFRSSLVTETAKRTTFAGDAETNLFYVFSWLLLL